MKDRKGFTLVELLLVVAILAFLVAIIVIASSEIGKDSKKKAMYASLTTVQKAIEIYNTQSNVFPATLDELLVWTSSKPRLVDAIPKDIYNGAGTTAVSYNVDTGGKPTYVSWSFGPDLATDITAAGDDVLDPVDPDDDIFVTNAKGVRYSQ